MLAGVAVLGQHRPSNPNFCSGICAKVTESTAPDVDMTPAHQVLCSILCAHAPLAIVILMSCLVLQVRSFCTDSPVELCVLRGMTKSRLEPSCGVSASSCSVWHVTKIKCISCAGICGNCTRCAHLHVPYQWLWLRSTAPDLQSAGMQQLLHVPCSALDSSMHSTALVCCHARDVVH